MSLIINDAYSQPRDASMESHEDEHRDLARLDRYLSIIENNKNACSFIPNDALVALDMAGYVRGQLAPGHACRGLSAARLALALVQPCSRAPVQ